MATSGTYTFSPDLGSLFLNAFSRCGVHRTALTAQHMADARNEANMLQVEWVNAGLLLWVQELRTFAMTTGDATYDIDANTIMVLDLYISPNGTAGGQDRVITPISRSDYASIANKDSQGFPTSFFFLRTTTPTLTFWPVPDASATYQASYWCYRQIQDADPRQGGNPEIQFRFIDAYTAGLAYRLSRHYAPALEERRKQDYNEAFGNAMKQDTENTPMFINPGISSYFRP